MARDISSGTDTIYARINSKDKNWLRERVQGEDGWSENLIVSELVKYFRSLSEEEQRNLVNNSSAFASVGALLNRTLWLQHAFGQKFWQWALEECYRLSEICERTQGSYELWTFAQYRAAFCWLEVAISLRREAIKLCRQELWDRYYEAADWAICGSIVHNRCHSAGRPEAEEIFSAPSRHPLVAYNLACGLSLRARYAIERKLGPRAAFFAPLHEKILEQDKTTPEQMVEFDKIPENWREDLKARHGANGAMGDFEKQIKRHVGHAMDELRKLNAPDSFPKDMLPRDKDFLHRYAPQDPDLALLKWDGIFKEEFDRWKQPADAELVTLRIFLQAKEHAPDSARKLIDKWIADNPLT